MEKIHVSIVYIFFYLCFRPKLDVKRSKKKREKSIFLSSIDSNFTNFFRQFSKLLRVGREIEVESIRNESYRSRFHSAKYSAKIVLVIKEKKAERWKSKKERRGGRKTDKCEVGFPNGLISRGLRLIWRENRRFGRREKTNERVTIFKRRRFL